MRHDEENMKLPKKVIVDTNVPWTANKAVSTEVLDGIQDEARIDCIQKCIEAIEMVIAGKRPVIDDGGEIFEEYSHGLSFSGQPGVGDKFFKWMHDNQWNETKVDRIPIPRSNGEYKHFPKHAGLKNFDPHDRKFVAVANAHPEKPPILQAVDFKWWGFKNTLKKLGITVCFLAPEYARSMYEKNFGTR